MDFSFVTRLIQEFTVFKCAKNYFSEARLRCFQKPEGSGDMGVWSLFPTPTRLGSVFDKFRVSFQTSQLWGHYGVSEYGHSN